MSETLREGQVEALANVIWTTSRADEGTISATGAQHVARAVVDFLAVQDRLAATVPTPDEVVAVKRLAELADDFESNVDWSNGRSSYGDNEAWESAARQLRALLAAATACLRL